MVVVVNAFGQKRKGSPHVNPILLGSEITVVVDVIYSALST